MIIALCKTWSVRGERISLRGPEDQLVSPGPVVDSEIADANATDVSTSATNATWEDFTATRVLIACSALFYLVAFLPGASTSFVGLLLGVAASSGVLPCILSFGLGFAPNQEAQAGTFLTAFSVLIEVLYVPNLSHDKDANALDSLFVPSIVNTIVAALAGVTKTYIVLIVTGLVWLFFSSIVSMFVRRPYQ